MGTNVLPLEGIFGDEDVTAPPELLAADPPVDSGQTGTDAGQTQAETGQGQTEQGQQESGTDTGQGQEPPKADQQAGEQQAATEQVPVAQLQADLAAARTELEELKTQLAEKDEEFVGIRVDGAVSEDSGQKWTGRQQFDGLPVSYQDDLIEHIFTSRVDPANPGSKLNLELFAEQALNANEFPEANQILLAATGRIMEHHLGRSFSEISKILTTFNGWSVDQIAAAVDPQRTLPRAEGADTAVGTGQPIAVDGSANLYRLAQERGLDVEDEATRGFLNGMDRTYRGLVDRIQTLEGRLGEFENTTTQDRESRAAMFTAEMHGMVDERAGQQINEAITSALQGKVADEQAAMLRPYIEAAVYRELGTNPKYSNFITVARDLAVDLANGKRELHPKVGGQLRAASVHVKSATDRAVANLLKHTVVQQAAQAREVDKAKANGTTLVGAASSQVSQVAGNPNLTAVDQMKINSLDDVTNFVLARQRARQGG